MDQVAAKGNFSLSVLSVAQVELIPKLGFVSGRDGGKLYGIDHELTSRGNPVFKGCIGWLECSVIERFDLGESTAFLSAVEENQRVSDEEPLVWSKLAPTLPEAWREQWSAKMARDIEHYRELMHWM